MPKPLDPMWVDGEPVQLPNRQILTCNLCGTKIYGGISRLKYHLARMPGFDVGPCLKTTPEIMRIATKSIMDIVDKREANEARRIELAGRSGSGNIGTSASGGTTNPLLSHRALNFCNPLINLTFLCVEI